MISSFLFQTKLLAFFIIAAASTSGGKAETVRCPRYCVCYLNSTSYMRSVSCVARRLDNIDLSVPLRVQSLDLSNNSISVLEDRGFQNLGLIEIVTLIMRHNSIRTIGLHSFAGLTYLQWVDLTANNLYQILPWTFHDNSNLKFVSLSGNPLGHIISSGPFLDIPSLEVLELSNCNFAHFSQDAFTALPNLQRLDISQNQLINFDMYSLQYLYSLEELDVSKNPWPCNTNLRNLKDFLESKPSRLIGSPCDLSENLQQTEVKPAMFEKIISVGVAYPEYDSSFSAEDNDSSEGKDSAEDKGSAEETLEQNKVECNCKVESKPEPLVSDFILPPMWLMIVSFHLGVGLTLLVGYFWTCCTRRKNKYVCMEQTLQPLVSELRPDTNLPETEDQPLEIVEETVSCPDTPPPSYRELFMT